MIRKLALSVVLAAAGVACTVTGSHANEAATVNVAQAGEQVRIVSYNIENWRENFQAAKLKKMAATQPSWPQEFLDLIQRELKEDDIENWEVARTVLHPEVNADILLIQEGCNQTDLNQFNLRFLQSSYDYVHTFPTNTGRDQHVGIMVKKGFKVLEVREDYYNLPKPEGVVTRGDKLFARGPGFVLIETPSGHKFWVGTNHQKSKALSEGETDIEVAQWRLAEAKMTNQIINELKKEGPAEVYFAGDMNDELGLQKFEEEAGGSAIEAIGGQGENALTILTQKLSDEGVISFTGYRSSRYRSMIDHAFATPEGLKHVEKVFVFDGDLAEVASDHLPVVVQLKFD
ncbi:MAG TPA: hypothetical protein PK402_05810 [Tepidisphaeraceae bacterium]|nr:hypothetical protein [Tepidisphaeraceae bacterium]